MPKRCAEEQLQLAWATRETRPDQKQFKGDDDGWHRAQTGWVESWDGNPLADEARRAAWWKESKKQHGKLCAKYELMMEQLGEPVAAAASTSTTVPATATASSADAIASSATATTSSTDALASSAEALASSADAPTSSADAASQAATALAAIPLPPGVSKAALTLVRSSSCVGSCGRRRAERRRSERRSCCLGPARGHGGVLYCVRESARRAYW